MNKQRSFIEGQMDRKRGRRFSVFIICEAANKDMGATGFFRSSTTHGFKWLTIKYWSYVVFTISHSGFLQ